jgi:tetratricopeptide (TPR) repeat protein
MNSDLQELYDLGTRLYGEGKFTEAEPVLREVIKINPGYADVHNKLGVISNLNGDLGKAAEHFEKSLEINPRYTEASLNLAVTYNDMGEFKKAQEVFSMAAQIAHPAPNALDPFIAGKLANEHFRVGNLYLQFNMNDEAIEEYRKAVKLHPKLPDIHTKLGIALRNKGLVELLHGGSRRSCLRGVGKGSGKNARPERGRELPQAFKKRGKVIGRVPSGSKGSEHLFQVGR